MTASPTSLPVHPPIGAADVEPIVTVVIPTYNRAGLVEQAIDSVLAQTQARADIIVVDDGSVDETATRLRRYADRITYVQTDHGGPAHARNVGMRLARGRYVAFLDSDDLYYPYKLALQVRLMEQHPDIGMTYSEFSAFDDTGLVEERHLRTYHESGFRAMGHGYDELFGDSVGLVEAGLLGGLSITQASTAGRRAYFGNIFDTYLLRTVVFTNSMLFRRDLLEDVGFQDESFRLFEDLDFALRICRRHRVCFLDIPTYQLRYHDGQLSTGARRDGKYIWIRKQQSLLKVVRHRALADPDYYRRHRLRVDQRLAHLHRAVAIPLLLFSGGTASTRTRYARRARPYLAGCRTYGHAETALWILSYAPGPLRRLGATVSLKAP